MRTGSALLHRWSAALEEYDFTVRHRPGKIQTHVDGLSRLPVDPAPPEDTILHIEVQNEEEARRLAQELHTAKHTSAAKPCGSCLATAISTRQAVGSA